MYIRSHGSYAPGEQRDRHYNWPVDPTTTRFGCKGDTIAFGGVSKNINDVLKYTDEKPSALSIKKVIQLYFRLVVSFFIVHGIAGGRFPKHGRHFGPVAKSWTR